MQFQFYSESYLPQVNAAVGNFVSELIWDEPARFGPFCSMAVAKDHELMAGVIFHNYQPDCGTIEVSCATRSPRWLNRTVIAQALSMPFEKLGCQAILARHSADNANARHIWNAMGAEEYIIPRLRGKGQPDECVAVLTDDAWAVSRFNADRQKVRTN